MLLLLTSWDSASLILLALALSLDSLTVGFLYGARGIRLSWGALVMIGMATGLLLGLAMFGGGLVAARLDPDLARRGGAMLLALVGLWITYQTWRTRPGADIPSPEGRRVIKLKLGSVGILIEILREPATADLDRSGQINLYEATFLGVALALDSMAAGLGAAMAGFSPVHLPVAAAGGSALLIYIGTKTAQLLPCKINGRWAILHGLMLVALGLYRMVI